MQDPPEQEHSPSDPLITPSTSGRKRRKTDDSEERDGKRQRIDDQDKDDDETDDLLKVIVRYIYKVDHFVVGFKTCK